MNRIACATMTWSLLLFAAPALRAQSPGASLTALAAPVLWAQDELPDGDLDFSADDLDAIDDKAADKKPADKKPADKKPVDKKPADKQPVEQPPADKKPVDKKPAASQPDAVPDLEPIKGDGEIVAPPDERGGSAGTPGGPEVEAWHDDDLKGGARPPVLGEDPEEEEAARGRVGAADDKQPALVENPLFWAGVGGGALLVAGAAVGGGFLVYYLLNANNGSVKVTLE